MSCSAVENSSAVSLEDCTCPICMSILIQPVTMPCTHELCMPCFRKTVEEANLCCPMCRLRISTWTRLSTKQKTLVNEIRWKQIQNLFPEKVRRRQEGKDDEDGDLNDEDEPIHHPIVNIAEPGEIRKEYEEQLERLEKQREEERSKEEAESADLIKKLQLEEEERARELERQAEEQRIKDEEIARQLAESAELSMIENGEDSMMEISPKLTRTHSTGTASKPNYIKTLDSFFFNKSSTDTSLLEDSPDIAQSSSSETPQKSSKSSENNKIFPANSPNRLENLPNSHREFVKNQFHVMSSYSPVHKPVAKSKPATVTSGTMGAPVDDIDTGTDEDSSMIFPPMPSPSRTSPTPSEFSISNISPTKKVIGLFPPQESNCAAEKQINLCSKHVKMKQKNSSYNTKVVTVDLVKEDSNLPKPVNDKTVSFVDSDYESDEVQSKSADSVLKRNSHARKAKNKCAILSSEHESDSAPEEAPSPKTKKVLKKRKSKTETIVSPQRSIKDWLSPMSNKKNTASNSQDGLELESSPKKLPKKAENKNGKNSSQVRKNRITKEGKVKKLSKGVSKLLQYADEDSNSTPLASKDNILNSDNIVSEIRKSRKSKTVSDSDSVPSPSKRRRKRAQISSDDDSENSESVSRSRSHSRKSKSKLTVISEGETTPNKKLDMPLDSEDEFIDTSKARTSLRKKFKGKASNNSPQKRAKKNKSPEKVNSIEKQVSDKRQLAFSKKKTKLDFDSVFIDNDETEAELDDFELALKLQREFDNEVKVANRVDRSKGSQSEYLLRRKPNHSPTKSK